MLKMASKATPPHISQITDYLYISAFPRGEHVEEIVALGVRLVLSMDWMRPTKMLGKPPVELLWLPTFDFILLPMPIKTLNKGVRAALPVIENGGSVLVRCMAGVHRSVAQGACVVIGMGYTADEAMQLIIEKRAVADPDARHIQSRIRKFEQQWPEVKDS
jgi:protein-tyrosine phosphatase